MKPRVALRVIGLWCLCSCFGSTGWAKPSLASAQCVGDSISLRPSMITGSRFAFAGEWIGETFYARDTVITEMTFWRPPTDRSAIGAHVFVVSTDTTSLSPPRPPRPDVSRVLLNGPTLTFYDSDPPGQTIEMRFPINPPLVLPGPGYYAWLLQPENCWQGEAWNLDADYNNPYPDGVYWLSGRVEGTCYLRGYAGWEDSTDLLFKIDFCTDSVTPVLRRSWGSVKTIYR